MPRLLSPWSLFGIVSLALSLVRNVKSESCHMVAFWIWFELSRGLGAAAVLGRASNRRTVRSWPRSRKFVFRFTPCLLYDFDALALLESGLSVRRAMLAHACIYTYCYLHLSRHHLHSHSDTTTCLYALCLIPPIPCSLTTYITIVFVLVLAVVLFVVLS